jgi:arylsulfatase A-like enzyme
MSKPYNVLMILADQHNAGQLGCAGHSQALTPNLDAFAASGVRFTNAYTQNTICTPSRISVLSGQYCHNHGYYGLSGPSNAGLDNFMRHFRKYGYKTAAYGKLHLPNSPCNWIGDDVDEFGDTYETYDGTFGKSDYLDELERLGMRHLEDSWHNRSGTYGPHSVNADSRVSKLPYEYTQEVWCARKAMQFMDNASEKPFCIQIAFQRPHHPLLPQQRFWDLYPEDIELPSTHDLEPGQRPPHFREAWKKHRTHNWEYSTKGEPENAGARRAWHGTLACVSQVDDVFGMLMQYLDEHKLADNTIVIYSSDHGGYHGVHGIREKAPGICSNAVCNIPFLLRVPHLTKPGDKNSALIEAVDFAPTLVALCDIPPMLSFDGHDLTPLLHNKNASVRTIAVTENVWSRAVRWDNWRFVHYPREMFDGADEGELYDINTDPEERYNLYHDPSAKDIVNESRRLLLEWLISTTRTVTTQPAVIATGSEHEVTRCTYPICTDGRAPNALQMRYTKNKNINYL